MEREQGRNQAISAGRTGWHDVWGPEAVERLRIGVGGAGIERHPADRMIVGGQRIVVDPEEDRLSDDGDVSLHGASTTQPVFRASRASASGRKDRLTGLRLLMPAWSRPTMTERSLRRGSS